MSLRKNCVSYFLGALNKLNENKTDKNFYFIITEFKNLCRNQDDDDSIN